MDKKELIELREKTEAVQKLMSLGKLDISDVDLAEVAKLEKRASKSPMEQLEELAKDNSDYKMDKLQQHLGAIKCIKAVRGMIFIGVDSYNSRKAATERAIRNLGVNAPPEKIKEYVDAHSYSDTLMSVKRFSERIKSLIVMVAMWPDAFGEGRGGTEVKAFIQEAKEVIKEARNYWSKLDNCGMLENEAFREEVTAPNFSVSDKASIKSYLGDDYKLIIPDEGNVVVGAKLTGITG